MTCYLSAHPLSTFTSSLQTPTIRSSSSFLYPHLRALSFHVDAFNLYDEHGQLKAAGCSHSPLTTCSTMSSTVMRTVSLTVWLHFCSSFSKSAS